MATMLEKATAAVEKRKLVSFGNYEEWLGERRKGITATEAKLLYKDAHGERERTKLIEEKRAGTSVDLSDNQYVQRGNEREPVIAAWIQRKFGIAPNDYLMRSPENPGHIATPDGLLVYVEKIGRKTFVKVTGAEIKTSKNDLTPGPIDEHDFLVVTDETRNDPNFRSFWITGYYEQMQWQMHILGEDCEKLLFAWEQHDNNWPSPQPLQMSPSWCWVHRDQAVIDKMVEAADKALEVLNAEDRAQQEAEAAELIEKFDDDVQEALALAAMIADLSEQKAAIEARIKVALADKGSASVEAPRWKLTYFTPNGRSSFDQKSLQKEHPDVFMKFYTPGIPNGGTPTLRLAPADTDTTETGE